MSITHARLTIALSMFGCLCSMPAAAADSTFFSTGSPDGAVATATRPDTGAPFEIESADDFILAEHTSITDATFTGLLPRGEDASDVSGVVVEIYRVFPALSDVGRTTGTGTTPPFQTPNVPTRLNSPSDVALDTRDSSSGLTFSTTDLGLFTASNSVQPGGIHPKPLQTTGGNGSVTGEEFEFDITFATPFDLSADHYFFVPQVELANGTFLWLSAAKPISGGTGPFVGDLQSWTRDDSSEGVAPDWLRVGTDIVGGTTPPTFNAAFSLSGGVVPEPSTWALMLLGFAGLGAAGYRASWKRALGAA